MIANPRTIKNFREVANPEDDLSRYFITQTKWYLIWKTVCEPRRQPCTKGKLVLVKRDLLPERYVLKQLV